MENKEEQAVRAAIEMIEMRELFNIDQAAQDKALVRIGIGIATGAVIAGYTGTINRATYTCVGNTVNKAARLEAHTKVVGQPILIDEATRVELSSTLQVEEHGLVQFKGKLQDVRIFAVPVG